MAQKMRAETETNKGPSEWTCDTGVLKQRGKRYVGTHGDVREKILMEFNSSAIGGPSGILATYQRIKRHFYWPGLNKFARSFVRECDIFQRSKAEHLQSPGLLQPLPIPNKIRSCITMDFIEGLPRQGRHFFGGRPPNQVCTFHGHVTSLESRHGSVFMENVFKLHGMPYSIISDGDTIFTSEGAIQEIGHNLGIFHGLLSRSNR